MSRLSHARLRPYLKKSNEDPHSAMKLYQWNIELSGAVYETLHRVEVIFRNALDEQLSIWNASQVNQQTGQSHSSDWLLDPSHLLQRLLGKDIEKAIANASRAVARKGRARRLPNHNDVLAQLSFGTWRYLMPDKDAGRRLLWRDAISFAFPHLESAGEELTRRVRGVHQLRNRIAHLEPLLQSGFVETEFANMRFILAGIDPEVETWMVSRQRVTSILRQQPLVLPWEH